MEFRQGTLSVPCVTSGYVAERVAIEKIRHIGLSFLMFFEGIVTYDCNI